MRSGVVTVRKMHQIEQRRTGTERLTVPSEMSSGLYAQMRWDKHELLGVIVLCTNLKEKV